MRKEKLFEAFPPVSAEAWKGRIEQDLKGKPFESLTWKTLEGIEVQPFYTAGDLEKLKLPEIAPGHFPFVRGNKIKSNEWFIRQEIAEKNPVKANKLILNELEKGASAIGIDCESIRTKEDIQALLKEVIPEIIHLDLKAGGIAEEILPLLIKELKEGQADHQKMKGSFDFDPIGEATLTGKADHIQQSFQTAFSIIKTLNNELPGFKGITIHGDLFHNAGSSIVQEIAFSLSAGNEYLANLTDKGLLVDEITRRLQFSFAVGSNYFMEIAKFRAFRLLWAKIVEQYQPSSEKAADTFIQAFTSKWNMTLYDPHVNILRATTEAMSAITGGVNVLSVAPFDAVYKENDEFSARIARNIQLILKEEAYLDKIVDPAAGSYYIEHLTDALAKKSWNLFKQVESTGGYLAALKNEYIQKEIQQVRGQKEELLADRKDVLLGTTQYPDPLQEMSDKITAKNKNQAPGNTDFEPLEQQRAAEIFETVRLNTEAYRKATGKRPKVFLLKYGEPAMSMARGNFITNFFGCAGYEIKDSAGFDNIQAGIEAATQSHAEIIALCSSDNQYPEIAEPVCMALKDKALIVVAGFPKENVQTLKTAGVDDFIHVRSNLLETLKKYQEKLGIQSASQIK